MDIRQRLDEWGEWQRSLEGALNSGSIIASYGPRGSRETGSGIRNPRAEALDIIIAHMMKKNYDYYEVISSIYIVGKSIPHTARDMRVSPATVKNLRNTAEAYIDGMVDADNCPNRDIAKLYLIG